MTVITNTSPRTALEVAPTGSRLYRGLAIRRAWHAPQPLPWPPAADCQSAIRQITNLRYHSRPSHTVAILDRFAGTNGPSRRSNQPAIRGSRSMRPMLAGPGRGENFVRRVSCNLFRTG